MYAKMDLKLYEFHTRRSVTVALFFFCFFVRMGILSYK